MLKYDLDASLDGSVEPGSNILIIGPTMSGKRELGFQILAEGSNGGEGGIIVSTSDGAERVLRDYRAHIDDVDSIDLRIIDCVSKQQGMVDRNDDRIGYPSSPGDMTGIGINLSNFLTEFIEDRALPRNRVLLVSVSTLLMYADLKTVFRFLHVFTGRIQTAEALGIYTIDGESHDPRTLNTIKQLFDGVISIGEGNGFELNFSRFRGLETRKRS